MGMRDVFNTIVVSPQPVGRWKECIVDGTPKPGTVMTIKAAVEPVNGCFTYEAFNADADGDKRVIAVLCEDRLQGKTVDSTAYVAGDRGFLYFPIPGDELLMLVTNAAGTDQFAIGDLLMVDDGTGKLIGTGSNESEPFQVLETLAPVALTADVLLHVMFTGY